MRLKCTKCNSCICLELHELRDSLGEVTCGSSLGLRQAWSTNWARNVKRVQHLLFHPNNPPGEGLITLTCYCFFCQSQHLSWLNAQLEGPFMHINSVTWIQAKGCLQGTPFAWVFDGVAADQGSSFIDRHHLWLTIQHVMRSNCKHFEQR